MLRPSRQQTVCPKCKTRQMRDITPKYKFSKDYRVDDYRLEEECLEEKPRLNDLFWWETWDEAEWHRNQIMAAINSDSECEEEVEE